MPEKHDRLILTLTPHGWDPVHTRWEKDAKQPGLQRYAQVRTSVVDGRYGRSDRQARPGAAKERLHAQWLYSALQQRHRQLKPLLLDQTFLAGLGNIYTDEALHKAKLHPLAALGFGDTQKQAGKLHTAIQTILQEAIRRNGASLTGSIAAENSKIISACMIRKESLVRFVAQPSKNLSSVNVAHTSAQIVRGNNLWNLIYYFGRYRSGCHVLRLFLRPVRGTRPGCQKTKGRGRAG